MFRASYLVRELLNSEEAYVTDLIRSQINLVLPINFPLKLMKG